MPNKKINDRRGAYMLPYKGSTKVQDAVRAIRSGTLSIRAAAAYYSVPKSTLADRVSGKIAIDAKPGRKPVIPAEVEQKIVHQVTGLAECGFGMSRNNLLIKSGELCKQANITTPFTNGTPGKSWWKGMKNRHPELTIRKPEKLGSLRARMLNREVVGHYFDSLGDLINKLNLQNKPSMIWNCDETGKQLEHTPVRVVAKKGSKAVVGRTSNSRANISILACVNASGDRMPPMLVVKGKTTKSLYGYNVEQAPPGTVFTFQKNAWMDGTIGLEWFSKVFMKNCGNERPQLLILDGHSSHETLELLEAAKANNIHLMSLPPHTTHYLQPLDRTVFGPFSKAYNSACSTFLSASPYNEVNKWTFPGLFRQAWDGAVTSDNIKSGFRACGVSPLDMSAVPDVAFAPSQAFDAPAPAPTATVTTAQIDSQTDTDPPSVEIPSMSDANVVTPQSILTVHTALPEIPSPDSISPSGHLAENDVNLPDNNDPLLSAIPSMSDVNVVAPQSTNQSTLTVHTASSEIPAPDVFTNNDPLLSASNSSDYLSQLLPLSANADDNQSDLNVDPVSLFDSLISGDITISDENSNPVDIWELGLENIFPSPKMEVKTTSTSRQGHSITSHRLLTSDDIISSKRRQRDDKEKKEHDKLERKRIREEKKGAKVTAKKSKGQKNTTII